MQAMERQTAIPTTSSVWTIVPCHHPRAYGVPVFRVFSESGFRDTAVTPLPLPGEACNVAISEMFGFQERHDLSLLLDELLDGVPEGVADSIRAFLAFKHVVEPAGAPAFVPLAQPLAGLLAQDGFVSAAIKLGTLGEGPSVPTAVLKFARTDGGVRLLTEWANAALFLEDQGAFAESVNDITLEHLQAGLASEAPSLVLDGVDMLLRDTKMGLPLPVIGVFLSRLEPLLLDTSLNQERFQSLLDHVAPGGRKIDAAAYEHYADALATLRQAVALVATKRKALPAESFDRLAALPSWQTLYTSIVDAFHVIGQVLDGHGAHSQTAVERELMNLAAVAGRPSFADQLTSSHARVLAMIGELADSRLDVPQDDLPLAARIRQLVRMLGITNWLSVRPYEQALLIEVIGGW
jgi:hypothetical protein